MMLGDNTESMGKDYDIRKLQLKELEILEEIDRLCKKHNIKYYLTWGTALGAVRHKGFIPWDDDIDISMHWKDYKKFEEICKTELNSKFFYQSRQTDNGHFHPFNKIRMNGTTSMPRELTYVDSHWGICMDIFPIINIPTSRKEEKKQKIYTKLYLNICRVRAYKIMKYKGSNKIRKMLYKILQLFPTFISDMLEKELLKKITIHKSDAMCGELFSLNYEEAVIQKNIYGQGHAMPFENKKYLVPEKYHAYLTRYYGDYMKLPAEKDRTGHGDIIVDFDNDYKHYLNL